MTKKIISWILLISISPAFLAAQEQSTLITDKIAKHESRHFAQQLHFEESPNYSDYDLLYQRLEWQVNPEIFYISGAVTSVFKSKTTSLTEIGFDLHAELIVDSIKQNNQPINFSRDNNKLLIELNQTLSKNDTDSLTLFYQGVPGDSGFGSFVQSTHIDVPVIWTLSEPYGALDWWPCKQSLSDKIDSVDIIVTSPEQYRTASNGILISETVSEGKRTMHWKHRYPIATYLVAIAVTNYIDYSDFADLEDGRQIEIQNFVYPEYEATARENTPKTVEIMQLFNELVGEYPFAAEKYGHAQFGWRGGMEQQTISFMYNFGFDLVAHELAHQWFGDCITLGSWQDIWLNEGFATYLTGLAYENLLDEYWWKRWKRLNVERIVSQPGGSVFVQDTTSLGRLFSSRLSYSKGAYLLHMLRWVLGDEAFFSAIKSYYEDPKVANGFARTTQLIEHFENAGDTILTEFFNDWLYGEGYPVYSARFAQNGTGILKFYLSQESSHPSVDFFEMPVQVRMFNIEKTDSIDITIIHSAPNQEIIVNAGFDVGRITIDPEKWLVSMTGEIIEVPWVETSEEIVVYPNPVKEILSVFVPKEEVLQKVSLFTGDGKLTKVWSGNLAKFNFSDVPNGVYILMIETDNQSIKEKILKFD